MASGSCGTRDKLNPRRHAAKGPAHTRAEPIRAGPRGALCPVMGRWTKWGSGWDGFDLFDFSYSIVVGLYWLAGWIFSWVVGRSRVAVEQMSLSGVAPRAVASALTAVVGVLFSW